MSGCGFVGYTHGIYYFKKNLLIFLVISDPFPGRHGYY